MRNQWKALAILMFAGSVWGCGKKTEAKGTPTEISEFHAAVQDGDADIVRRLVQAKPYLVNEKNEQGLTPLKVAEEKGNEELAEVLKKAGGHD
jgi:ankyrin repeat protein